MGSRFFWSKEEINERLVHIMSTEFALIWQVSEERKVSPRTAAFIAARQHMLQARDLRGLYPLRPARAQCRCWP